MSEASGESALERFLRALAHPIRRRVLRTLVDGPGSATTISRALGLNLGVVSYHLNQVLAEECEVVELVESVPRRGAIEKVYRLKFEAVDAPADAPKPSLEECFMIAVMATPGGR